MANYRVTTAPATEPITTAEAKSHLNIDHANDDTYIDTLIESARIACEFYCNRAFITQTVTQEEDYFRSVMPLKLNPVSSVTSIKYYDENETQQTLTAAAADRQIDLNSDVANIREGLTNTFPSIGDTINPIEIIYVAGYGAASTVPLQIKHAIKLMVSHLYENREGVNVPIASMATQIPLPDSVRHLLAPYRVRHFG